MSPKAELVIRNRKYRALLTWPRPLKVFYWLSESSGGSIRPAGRPGAGVSLPLFLTVLVCREFAGGWVSLQLAWAIGTIRMV